MVEFQITDVETHIVANPWKWVSSDAELDIRPSESQKSITDGPYDS